MDLSPVAVALGAMVGLILAMTGAGGGILAVPLLVFGMHLSIVEAAPVGLIAVGAASAIGAVLGLREGLVRYRAAAVIGLVGISVAPLGVLLARIIPNPPLTVGFAAVLLYVAARMWLQARRRGDPGKDPIRADLACVLHPVEGRLAWTMPCARALAATGAASGLLRGLLGVGGGFVIVPALSRYTNLSTPSILATSLAVIALVSAGGVTAAAIQGVILWRVAVPFGIGAVVSLLLGRSIVRGVAGPQLQQAFAAISALVALLLLARAMGWIAGYAQT